MASKVYPAVALTGGGTGALDAIDGNDLSDGDVGIVTTSTHTYIYSLDAASSEAEASPTIIAPDNNGGSAPTAKRWLLVTVRATGLVINDAGTIGSASDTDAIAISSGGVVTFSKTIGVTGGQIAFPSTAVPSADANTLDDYQEGTWTPAGALSTPGNSGNASNVGRYTIIGRMCYVTGTTVFTMGTGTGTFTITGLPETAAVVANLNFPAAIFLHQVGTANETPYAYVASGADVITFTMQPEGTGASSAMSHADLGTTANFYFTICYQI